MLRDIYVQQMCAATQHVNPRDRRTIVYSDESFIHHHYNKSDMSLYDPSDDLDSQPKAKHKGKRYCFIGAIVDDGESNSRQYQDDTTFHDVGQRLDTACASLTSHAIFGCIGKAEHGLLDLHKHVSIIDDDNYEEECHSDGNESDGSVSSSSSQSE
ncbi:hypothetical protein H257_15129 [Aphanomyces astaci]|uniref:Uncharacterized protein n=1 Tax=Aphanomyces astaci TaxID=112090 RepID=W4FNA2_APHAT|nr:hypothetical protein H257_15129 [Aphanomyces astaci]ETV68972.1 hypothetical protein H257_15129 [Aphanomyces astaci]|eukprot:XP_009841431.1 hypothetical protein H257_15129 [Aphanomyces astaci]